MQDEIKYKLLKLLQNNSSLTQRQMAEHMGVSLGKLNYCLASFTRKGLVKVNRFTSSDNKATYAYILTPRGIEAKSRVTVRFLRLKMKEYEEIQAQIRELEQEFGTTPHTI